MQDLLSLTQTLMGFQTMESRPDEIRRCTDFIRTFLTRHGLCHEILHVQGAPSILITPAPERSPVLLVSHMDVVRAPEALFTPCIRDGFIWGRGAVDDKYAIALSLHLLLEKTLELRKKGLDTKDLPFGLLITSDEETGGERGTGAILPRLSCDFAIILDGGTPDEIVVRQKGILRLRLEARGKNAHGARPWLGQNALEGLMADLGQIRSLFSHQDALYWEKTLNIGRMEGGNAVNQVPDSAFALLDVRFTEKDDPTQMIREMEKKLRFSHLTQESLDPVFTAGNSSYLSLLALAAPQARYVHEHGASDAHYFSENHIPAVVWGADGEMSQHSDEERVRIDSLALLLSRLRVFFSLCEAQKKGDA